MKKSLSYFKRLFLFFAAAVSFSACSAGLGEEVDTVPPELKITSHVNMQYVRRNFTLSGTCSDSHGVKKVEIKNTQTKEVLGYATISGESWSFEYTASGDVELPLTATASDAAGNSGESSVDQITLVVDSQNPVLKTCYIKRSGKFLVNFTAKEALKNYYENKNDTGSKDFLQNESIVIEGSVADNYRAERVTLSILDEDGNVILSEIPSDPDTTAYTPAFTITQQMLTDAKSELASGVHYLHAKVDVYDGAKNYITEYRRSFCWYAESDLPNISFPLGSKNSDTNEWETSVSKETPMPVNLFDDDGIAEVYYKLLKGSEWSSVYNETSKTFNLAGFTKKTEDGKRDLGFTENAAEEAGLYYLAVAVLDKKSDNSDGVWNYEYCKVNVTADSVPTLIVESPSENSAPTLTENKFTLKAYTLDKKPVEKAAFAWIPNGLGEAEGIEKAKELLAEINFASFTSKTDGSGIKYEKITVTQADDETIGEKTYKKSTFSKEFDVTEYFSYNGQIENAVKTFVIYVVGAEGEGTYRIFRLGSYSDGPSIAIKEDGLELSDLVSPVPLNKTFTLKVSAKGFNGLKLKSLTGSYVTDAKDATPVSLGTLDVNDENSVNLTISEEKRYTLTVEAEDIFGNKAKSSKTFVPGETVSLTKFTSGLPTGVYLIAGDILTMQAEFSGPVAGMNETKVELTNIKGVTGTQYAVCSSNLESDSIVYTYKVPDGAYTESGDVVSSGTKIINANETKLYTLSDETEVLGKNATIYVDAVAPKIVSYSPAQNIVIGDDKKITITFDDNIYIESGTITVERTTGWAIPPVLTADEFTEIYATLSDEDKINFIGSTDGNPKLTNNSAQPVGPYKKITHGVKEFTGTANESYVDKSGDAVPDASTKYVLAFDYDIYETDGVVEKIRKALEGYGYHKKDYDISDTAVSVSGKALTITLDSDVLVDGREFTVTIPAGCVRDEAGNVNKELKRDTYKFWSQKTAKPVIRTDRYTHGADTHEPYMNGSTIAFRDVGVEDIDTEPTGQIRVRIDCETPNASIKYGTLQKKSTSIESYINGTTTLGNDPDSESQNYVNAANVHCEKTTNATMTEIQDINCSTTYNGFFLCGDSGWNYAEKNYIKAEATKDDVASEPSYEHATKTILYYGKPQVNDSKLNFQGSDSSGEPIVSGFPMRDANPEERYMRFAYKNGENDWVCVSWDFITSDWRLQSFTSNYQKPEYKNLDYGIALYVYNKKYW